MPVTYTPSADDAQFTNFTGRAFDDPANYTSGDNKRIDAKYFLKPIQDEVLNLIRLVNGGGAFSVRNESGGILPAGPVRIAGYSAAQNKFLIALADADANAPAQLLLLADAAHNTNVLAYPIGDFTSTLNTSGSSVGAPVYLSATGGITLTAPSGADQIVQVVGRVKTLATSGVIAGRIETPMKIGTAWLQPGSIDATLLAAAVAGNGLSGGGGAALAVNVDNATLEINADALRVKNSGIAAAQLHSDVAGSGLAGGAGSALSVNVDNATLEINADALRLKDAAINSAKLADGVILNSICGARLTTETGVAVSTADRSGAQCQTIYCTPYTGNRIALYDGTRWQLYTFSEPSLALSGLVSGKNYDVFAYWNGSAVALELSSAWSTDTVRTDGISRQDGVLVKTTAPARRYLGTIRMTATNQTEDSAARRFVWNFYNRVAYRDFRAETADSWTDNGGGGSGGAWSAINGGGAVWKHEFVRGVSEDAVLAAAHINCASKYEFAIALDSASAIDRTKTTIADCAATTTSLTAIFADYPSAGYHYLQAVETTRDGTVCSAYGDNAAGLGSGSVAINSGFLTEGKK